MAQDYGLRISQPGFDVKTATDAQCVFTSKSNTLKILMSGVNNITIPVNTGSNVTFNTTVNHNLGYVPAIMANPSDGNNTASGAGMAYTGRILRSGNACYPNYIDNISYDYDIGTATVKFYIQTRSGSCSPAFWPNSSGSYVVNIKYFIFSQQINI